MSFSVGFGWLTTYIPRSYTYYISTALFAIFGIKMLRDGYYMSPNEGKEELDEVQSDLRKREDEVSIKSVKQIFTRRKKLANGVSGTGIHSNIETYSHYFVSNYGGFIINNSLFSCLCLFS